MRTALRRKRPSFAIGPEIREPRYGAGVTAGNTPRCRQRALPENRRFNTVDEDFDRFPHTGTAAVEAAPPLSGAN